MTGPALRAIRRAVTASVVALLFGVVLVAVAGRVDATVDAPGVPDRSATVGTVAPDLARGAGVDASVVPPSHGTGTRPAAVRGTGERIHPRVVLLATAAALAALLAALAAIGRAGAPGVEGLRRLGAVPLGARAPPAALAA